MRKATTWSYRRVNRSRWTQWGHYSWAKGRWNTDSHATKLPSPRGLGLTAAHEMCIVVRAAHRKLHKLSGLGKQKRKAGKPWIFKESREWTSWTKPWTTWVQNRLKVILWKAKDLNRGKRSYCMSNRVLQFKPCQENDSLNTGKTICQWEITESKVFTT